MKIGLIGFGSIGSYVARRLKGELVWVVDAEPSVARRMAALGVRCSLHQKIPEKCKGAELVVEAASQEAVPLLLECLPHCDVMVMSVGALADLKLLAKLEKRAREHKRKIYLPSGAIGGLDAISSIASEARSVLLETVKPPASLGRRDRRRTVIFEGSARKACALFPKNVNVSATLALAGVGFEKTKVRIVSDPKVKRNTHHVFVKSAAGSMSFAFENMPSKENPKTSALAALSALSRIRKIKSVLQIG